MSGNKPALLRAVFIQNKKGPDARHQGAHLVRCPAPKA